MINVCFRIGLIETQIFNCTVNSESILKLPYPYYFEFKFARWIRNLRLRLM